MSIHRRTPADNPTPLSMAITWLAPVVIVVVAWLAYRHSFDGPFIFDDKPAIADNPFVRQLSPLSQAIQAPPQTAVSGRPVVALSLAINYSMGGYAVGGYHVFNLVAHMAAALVLYGVIRRTLRFRWASKFSRGSATLLAMVIAATWAVHPLASDTVLYVSNRTELLMGLFAFLTLYCTERSLEGRRSWMWNVPAVIACLLGMLSKESMAALPLLVVAYDWVFTRDTTSVLFRKRWPLYVGLTATWIPLATIVFSGARSLSVGFHLGVKWWEYLFTQTHALLIYLKLSVWPLSMSILYDTPVISEFKHAAIPGTFIVALLTMTVLLMWKRNWIGFIGAWFFLILAPSSSVVPLVTEYVTERRMYAPLAAIVALIVILFDRSLAWMERHTGLDDRIRMGFSCFVAAGLISTLVWLTDRRTNDFDSERLIYEDAVEKAPNSHTAHNNLGQALASEGRMDEAIHHYKRAATLKKSSAEAWDNLGVAYAMTGRWHESRHAFAEALGLAHELQLPAVLNDFAYLLATCPDPTIRNGREAVRMAEDAVRMRGESAGFLDTLAAAYAASGRFADAARTARRGIELAQSEGNQQAMNELTLRLREYDAATSNRSP